MENMRKYEKVAVKNKCYIYPSGGCAEVCVNVLKDCLCGVEFVMLDDRSQETSLECFKDEVVGSDSYLLLCAGDIQEELYEKCVNFGIKNIIDGREYTAFLLAKEFNRETKSDTPKYEILENGRILHIFDTQWTKHFYYYYNLFTHYMDDNVLGYLCESVRKYCDGIDSNLRALKGFFLDRWCGKVAMSYNRLTYAIFGHMKENDIVLYSPYLKYIKDYPRDRKILVAPWVLVSHFLKHSVEFVLGGTIPRLYKNNICRVGIGHTLVEAFQFYPKCLKQETLKRYLKNYFKDFTHYIAIDKPSYESFSFLFKELNLDIKVLKGGSISIDTKIADFNYLDFGVEQFFFTPRIVEIKEVEKVVEELLKLNKKAIVRPHHSKKNYIGYLKGDNPYVIFNKFKNDKNFTFDEAPNISKETLAKSIVITDNSSTGYSTPLSTLRPTILFCPPKNEFDLRVENFGKSFVNPILHRVAISAEECVKVALQLEQDLASGGGGKIKRRYQKVS